MSILLESNFKYFNKKKMYIYIYIFIFKRSFVFRKRVKTPPKIYKQHELGSYLSMQIDSKNKEVNLARQELDYIERMEQLQLAEE